jgi:hypothetical protein
MIVTAITGILRQTTKAAQNLYYCTNAPQEKVAKRRESRTSNIKHQVRGIVVAPIYVYPVRFVKCKAEHRKYAGG